MFLFNDALNTFYLRLYGVWHMVKNHSDSERGNPLPPHGLPISSKVFLYVPSKINEFFIIIILIIIVLLF